MPDERDLKKRICAFAAGHGFAGVPPGSLQLLAMGGSDRSFYRVPSCGDSCVAMVAGQTQGEQQAWLEIARFLQACGIAAPEIIAQDEGGGIVLVEDLGDASMYRALSSAADRAAVIALYQKALEFLAELQVRATPRMYECACLRERRFDYAAFRYETDYFLRSFLREYCGIEPPAALAPEFHRLAGRLAAQPREFMHRDFQSQNMILKHDRIRIIDFQTATAGPAQYDLASFLKDAYFVLTDDERNQLLGFYCDVRRQLGAEAVDVKTFTQVFHLAGLQRNMQALAAFSFLGTHKKKKHFLQHIPAALGYLAESLTFIDDYPALRETVAAARSRLPLQ